MSPLPGAPTVAKTQGAPAANNGARPQQPVVPFIRASHERSKLAFTDGPVTLNTTQQNRPNQQISPIGYLKYLTLYVQVASSGNSAAVAFQPDAPFNILQNITFLTAAGEPILNLIDGFGLAMINKWLCIGSGPWDPVADPNYSATTGTGGTGGSATFILRIPLELDTRDAFGALPNMAANQAYQLQYSVNSLANIYSVAPTVAPTVTVTAVMEYWSTPSGNTQSGAAQAVAPMGNGSVNLIQTQTPNITPNAQQSIQSVNVGDTLRAWLLILRNSSGVRTETDFPNLLNMYVNGDPWYYKPKWKLRSEMARRYGFNGAPAASPTAGAQDAGVFVISDLISRGGHGDEKAQASSDRNSFLVTNSATGLNFEAVSWGANASQLLIVTNAIRVKDAASLYAPQVY